MYKIIEFSDLNSYCDIEKTRACIINGCYEIHWIKGYCKKHYDQKWNKEHLQSMSKTYKKWYKKNREKILKRCKIYRDNNVEKIKEKARIYRNNNPEKVLESQKKYFKKIGKLFDMTSGEYQHIINTWSRSIKKLDNKICKNCDSTKNLHAHHIYPKAQFPELAFDLDNGVTLCNDCHGETHGFNMY